MNIDAPIRCSECATRTHAEWLAKIQRGDIILVRNGALHFRAEMTGATPCYLLSGKLKFRRLDGWIVNRQRVNRLNLRLVRNQEEFR